MRDDDKSCLRLPGCLHQLHIPCALAAVQYDGRCPVCRNQAVSPPRRPAGSHDALAQLEQHLADRELVLRRYRNRRSRAIRQRDSLRKTRDRLKEERREINLIEGTILRRWASLQKAMWSSDPQLVDLKDRRRKHQRRASALNRKLRDRIEPIIGVPPFDE